MYTVLKTLFLSLITQHIEMLEGKVSALTTQLDGQLEHQRSSERRAQKAEGELFSLEERLRRAEGELSAGDVLRDGMRADKERVSIVVYLYSVQYLLYYRKCYLTHPNCTGPAQALDRE